MDLDFLIGWPGVYLAIALFIILCIFLGVRIVPQSEKHVVERFGRLRSVLGPGINFVVPFLDRIAHKVSVLERQLPNASQDAITADNVLVKVETSVFYRVTEPEKTVYRIRDVDGAIAANREAIRLDRNFALAHNNLGVALRDKGDVDGAIATTVAGIVRSEIGKLELDQVQSNRAQLIERVREQVTAMVDDWGVEVTRAEILDVNLDEATRAAMLQQLNAERARRAQVMEAEGKKRSVELAADADLFAAEQAAKARRVTADAEAYATGVIASAIKDNGIEAAQFQVALKQVEALQAVAVGQGKQTILVPANALEAFGDAFKMLKGRV